VPRRRSTSSEADETRKRDLRLFISYRREDAPMAAGRLSDELARRFGDEHVFMDVDRIEPGVDFTQAINTAVGSCDVLIAIIGPHWLTMRDEEGSRRLDAPRDYVRLEIEAALKRNVRVIPALVEGADMPGSEDLPPDLTELATRNCVQLGDGVRWRYDVEGLMRALERLRSTATEEVVPPPRGGRKARPAGAEPAGPRRLWSKRRGLLALVAAALVAAAVLGIVLTRGSSRGSEAGMQMMKPGAFPDAIEDELLLAHIPSGKLRESCRRAAPIAVGFLRTVKCSQGAGSVTYSRAHAADTLFSYFDKKVTARQLVYPTKTSCRSGPGAADEWKRSGTQTHIEQRSDLAEGRVLCYRDGPTSWIVWTDIPTKLLGEASRSTSEWSSLYSWWQTAAGPEKENLMVAGMSARTWPYPDAIEHDLLLQHIPRPIRKTCKRGDPPNHNDFLRAVECSQGSPDAPVTYMYAHSADAMKAYSTEQIDNIGLPFPSGGRCATSSKTADKWFAGENDIVHIERTGRRPAGRVLCWANAEKETIEWTDNDTGIYAIASRPVSERRALYSWWRNKAGPGALEMTPMKKG
jgi:hypothetical protein